MAKGHHNKSSLRFGTTVFPSYKMGLEMIIVNGMQAHGTSTPCRCQSLSLEGTTYLHVERDHVKGPAWCN